MAAGNEVLITDAGRLAAMVDQATEAGIVALDTEFVWTKTYYAVLGLVQVGWSPEHAYLVDTTVLDKQDLAPLAALLVNPGVKKLLHDAPQDLTILRRATGADPVNIFDTRLGCGFCGWSAAWGLGRLLTESMGIELDKTETRTDWVRRPLTESQIEYALDDIKYLPRARELLLERVEAAGNTAWLEEEMQKYDDASLYQERDPYEQYQRIKGAGSLKGPQVAALRALAAWREVTASERDLPRNRVLHDEGLVDVARALPDSESSLRRVQSKYRALIEKNIAGLVGALRDDQGSPIDTDRGPRMDTAARKQLDGQIKRVSEKLKSLCEGLLLDPIMVATRADLRAFVLAHGDGDTSSTRVMQGWRREAVGEDLTEFMNA